MDICLPHHLHAEAIVIAAAGRKAHLVREAALLDGAQAEQVQQAVSAAGVTLMCAHQLSCQRWPRQSSCWMTACSALSMRFASPTVSTTTSTRRTWAGGAATSGGGELMDTGYHPTYLMLHFAGGSPVEATAMLSRHRLRFMEGEDSAQVLVRFDNGVVGQLVTSWAYDPPPGTERFSVVGERGSLKSDGRSLTVTLRGSGSQTYDFEDVDTYAYEIGQFADCLRSGTRPCTPRSRHRRALPHPRRLRGCAQSDHSARLHRFCRLSNRWKTLVPPTRGERHEHIPRA